MMRFYNLRKDIKKMPMDIRDRITAYLDATPPCVAGQHGDEQLFKVACVLYNGWALSEDETLAYLTYYNEKCQPPWPHGRLEYKAKEAARVAHEKPRGHLLGEQSLRLPAAPIKLREANLVVLGEWNFGTAGTPTTRSRILNPLRVNDNQSPSASNSDENGHHLAIVPEFDVVGVPDIPSGTGTTAKSEKSGAGDQWKVPDPPPGLNWAGRQKFYMDDLRDAIGDEWITHLVGPPWSS